MFPDETPAIAVGIPQRVTNGIVTDRITIVGGQQVAPIGIAITITVGALGIRGCNILPCQRICVFLPDIAGIVILIDIGLAKDGIVLPQRLALISGC